MKQLNLVFLSQRILSLETLRERNTQQLLAKEQEISTMRQQLRAEGGELVASLQNQLDKKTQEAEQRQKLFQNLSQETEDLKNKLIAVTEKCQTLEKRSTDMQVGNFLSNPIWFKLFFKNVLCINRSEPVCRVHAKIVVIYINIISHTPFERAASKA